MIDNDNFKQRKKEKKLSNKMQEKAFHIRLQTSNQELDLSNTPNFIKLIEQEYACKYLETLKIAPTQKNINMILKFHPLKNCKITASWKTSSLYADTITILPKKTLDIRVKQSDSEKDSPPDELLKSLVQTITQEKNAMDLLDGNKEKEEKREERRRDEDGLKSDGGRREEGFRREGLRSKEGVGKKKFYEIEYNLDMIKNKYVFPFNETIKRKHNICLKDDYEGVLPAVPENAKEINILNRKIFGYPFTIVKLTPAVLKELQNPISIRPTEILNQLTNLSSSFPRSFFPFRRLPPHSSSRKKIPSPPPSSFHPPSKMHPSTFLNPSSKKNFAPSSSLLAPSFKKNNPPLTLLPLTTSLSPAQPSSIPPPSSYFPPPPKSLTFLGEAELEKVFEVLASEKMAKFTGIFSHLAYWLVFGHVNPVEMDLVGKKQMVVELYEMLMSFGNEFPVWIFLGMPMLILTLKMVNEWIFRRSYPLFFEEEEPKWEIGLHKIEFLITRLFDQNNLNSRFLFLESDADALMKKMENSVNERQYLRKRLYGLSPFLDLMIPNPQDGRTRAIMSKKADLELKDGMLKLALNNREKEGEGRKRGKEEGEEEQEKMKKLNSCYDLQMFHVYLNNNANKEGKRFQKSVQ